VTYYDHLPSKFKVSTFTQCEDAKDDAKCRNLGVLQGHPSHPQRNHSTERIRLPTWLIVTMSLS